MGSIIHENMPQDGDGCGIRSWRCNNPNKKDMENGRVDGTTIENVRKECKRCPVCMMILCKYHMSEASHMMDCNFRSNQERQLLEEQRIKEDKIKQETIKKASEEARAKAEFEEKERKRKATIAERNRRTIHGQ